MFSQFLFIVQSIGGILAGSIIGVAFGHLQQMASRKHQAQETTGSFNSGWAVMPGSFRRTAFLIIALALIQILCPLLFTNGTQWFVSGGVVIGYGFLLWRELRRKLAARI